MRANFLVHINVQSKFFLSLSLSLTRSLYFSPLLALTTILPALFLFTAIIVTFTSVLKKLLE